MSDTPLNVPEGVALECPCGKPLSIGRLEDGRWILGHFGKSCSFLIYDEDANKVLEKYMKAVKEGKFRNPHWSDEFLEEVKAGRK
jgi:hypothetical protein